MVNCAVIVFQSCNHCIYESIPLYSLWLSTLNLINTSEKKLTVIPIDQNIMVIHFEPVQIRGWRNDTKSIMNQKSIILETITEIQYSCSESIHIRYRNVDTELISMCFWKRIFIKAIDLDLRTTICTVSLDELTHKQSP